MNFMKFAILLGMCAASQNLLRSTAKAGMLRRNGIKKTKPHKASTQIVPIEVQSSNSCVIEQVGFDPCGENLRCLNPDGTLCTPFNSHCSCRQDDPLYDENSSFMQNAKEIYFHLMQTMKEDHDITQKILGFITDEKLQKALKRLHNNTGDYYYDSDADEEENATTFVFPNTASVESVEIDISDECRRCIAHNRLLRKPHQSCVEFLEDKAGCPNCSSPRKDLESMCEISERYDDLDTNKRNKVLGFIGKKNKREALKVPNHFLQALIYRSAIEMIEDKFMSSPTNVLQAIETIEDETKNQSPQDPQAAGILPNAASIDVSEILSEITQTCRECVLGFRVFRDFTTNQSCTEHCENKCTLSEELELICHIEDMYHKLDNSTKKTVLASIGKKSKSMAFEDPAQLLDAMEEIANPFPFGTNSSILQSERLSSFLKSYDFGDFLTDGMLSP